jgi:hypothetical protein
MSTALLYLVFLLPLLVSCQYGVSFNETMSGFYAAGNMSFTAAYSQGQALHQVLSFALRSVADNLQEWAADANHSFVPQGMVQMPPLTAAGGAAILQGMGAYLRLFDGGVQNDTLFLDYFLPFQTANGTAVSLVGRKYLRGDDCIDMEQMFTTLYTHIVSGHSPAGGAILYTAIIKIVPANVVNLFESVRWVGNGTDADKMTAAVAGVTTLATNLQQLCLEFQSATDYWYVWKSQGNNAFLLDSIRRPDELELRLALYAPPAAPQVLKQYLPLSQFSQTGPLDVNFGSVLQLSPTAVKGSVLGTAVSLGFSLSADRNNTFVPTDIDEVFVHLIPNITSEYGALSSGNVAGVSYAPGPFVFTRYTVGITLPVVQWAMISLQQVPNSDLQFEVMALRMLDDVWSATGYVFYKNQSHGFDDPFLFETSVDQRGVPSGSNRIFSCKIDDRPGGLRLAATCSAPTLQFAELDIEGSTAIRTSLMGACNVTMGDGSHFFASGALLEVKEPVNATATMILPLR